MVPDHVELVEVGPRDGLQNESTVLDAATKAALVLRLVDAGLRRIEVVSYVNPQRVPQMADAEEVLSRLGAPPEGVSYIGLVLNERGLGRALAGDVDEINFVVGATEGFNRANAGVAPEETMTAIESMLGAAAADGRFTTVTISVAFGCPFQGEVPVSAVAALAARAVAAGADEVALGDTIGVAVPSDVVERIRAVADVVDGIPIRCHFHDTRNTATANAMAAIAEGVTVLDASVGGAGGCPFAPDATGNVATEDLVYLLDRQGIGTGVDMEAVAATGRWLGSHLGRSLPSAVARAGGFPGGTAP